MVNRIVLNTISYHGKGAIENIVPELTSRGYTKAFVCSDPDLIKFGVTKKVTDLLDAAGFAYTIYSDIKPNPTIENVQHGVAAYQASGADSIVTIGGGSSMDTAKAIGIIVNNPEFADVRSLEGVAPTSVFSTAPRRCLLISRMASRWNISEMAQCPLVIYPSMAWVKASIPVAAVRPLGMERIMSGSTTATSGMSLVSTQTNLRCFSTSVIT